MVYCSNFCHFNRIVGKKVRKAAIISKGANYNYKMRQPTKINYKSRVIIPIVPCKVFVIRGFPSKIFSEEGKGGNGVPGAGTVDAHLVCLGDEGQFGIGADRPRRDRRDVVHLPLQLGPHRPRPRTALIGRQFGRRVHHVRVLELPRDVINSILYFFLEIFFVKLMVFFMMTKGLFWDTVILQMIFHD